MMNINEELVLVKYQEMKLIGITEDFLNKEAFGDLKIFINKKPGMVLFSFQIDDLEKLYIGAD